MPMFNLDTNFRDKITGDHFKSAHNILEEESTDKKTTKKE